MADRWRLAVASLVILVICAPLADAAALFDLHHLTWIEICLLVALPPFVSLGISGISIAPSSTRPHSRQGDLLGIAVGLVSLWTLAAAGTAGVIALY